MHHKIEFKTAIRGHHIYEDTWVPCLGQDLMCRTNTREEAMEYDNHAIDIYKSENSKSLVGHLPMELSCLLTNFLNAGAENKLHAIVIGKRKREMGLFVPAKYVAVTKDKRFAEILVNKLLEKKEKHPNFELEVITNDVFYSVTKWEI